jgi:lipid-A-disaccharide synthase
MRASELMLIASGTATLEATCLGTPMVILYKMSHLSWMVLRRLVKLERSGLPNIIAGREIVPELLQSEVQTDRITEIALDLLHHPEQRESQRAELRKVYEQLGTPGAAERVAQLVLGYLRG